MLVWRFLGPSSVRLHRIASTSPITRRQYATRSFDPLRILFCGSDQFSIASLDALHAVSQQDKTLIESIDVVSRSGKWTGPYKKIFKEVPIADHTRSLGLRLHQIDTFRGWTPPSSNINLIIAVSFGLLIPGRLINAAKYGGLNVHPSLLPDLWGPAPIQHALLDGDEQLGLTIQTLHPTTMDKGAILAQTTVKATHPAAQQSFGDTTAHLAPLGAELLVDSLRKGLFVESVEDPTPHAVAKLEGRSLRHAKKITLEDKHIDWNTWSADKIIRYQRFLQKLWNMVESPKGQIKIVWSGDFLMQSTNENHAAIKPGIPYLSFDGETVLVNTSDGQTLSIYGCIVAGDKPSTLLHAVQKYDLLGADAGSDGLILSNSRLQ